MCLRHKLLLPASFCFGLASFTWWVIPGMRPWYFWTLVTSLPCPGSPGQPPRCSFVLFLILPFSLEGVASESMLSESMDDDLEALHRRDKKCHGILGWRPSLVGWMLLGWRPLILGWRPSQVGWRSSQVGSTMLFVLFVLRDASCLL